MVSPHKVGRTIREARGRKQTSAIEDGKFSRRRNASLGFRSDDKRQHIKKDLTKATRLCHAVTNALGRVVDEQQLTVEMENSLKDIITKFYSVYPEDCAEWDCLLYDGQFYPILAYCSIYKVEVKWELSEMEQDEKDIKLLNMQYAKVFRFAFVYGKLGEEALEHLKRLGNDDLASKQEWDERKCLLTCSFDTVVDAVGIYNLVERCVNQDRWLRKIQDALPEEHPWNVATRFFPKRPPSHLTVPTTFFEAMIKEYADEDQAPLLIEKLPLWMEQGKHDQRLLHAKKRLQGTLEALSDYDLREEDSEEEGSGTGTEPFDDDVSRDDASFIASSDDEGNESSSDDGSHLRDASKRDKPYQMTHDDSGKRSFQSVCLFVTPYSQFV